MTQLLNEYSYGAQLGVVGGDVDGHDAADYIYRTNSGDATVETIATTTVGGTIGTETFTMTPLLNLPENPAYSFTVTTIANGTTIATATQVAADLVRQLNLNGNFYRVAYASNVAGVITVTIRASETGRNPITSITNTKTGSATITASPAVTSFASGSNVPYGYAVAIASTDSDTEARLWKGTGSIVGICGLRRSAEQAYAPYTSGNVGISQLSPVDYIPVGGQLGIKRKGRIYVLALDAVTRGGTVYANDTTGQLQAASSGGTAVTINGVTAKWDNTTTAANSVAVVQL